MAMRAVLSKVFKIRSYLLRAMSPLHPFIHLPQHHAIVSKTCKYAGLSDKVDTYFSYPTRHKFNKELRDKIIKEIRLVDGLIYNPKRLDSQTPAGFNFQVTSSV